MEKQRQKEKRTKGEVCFSLYYYLYPIGEPIVFTNIVSMGVPIVGNKRNKYPT